MISGLLCTRTSLRASLLRVAKLLPLALVPLVCGGWQGLFGPQSTLDTKGPVSEAQTGVFYVTLWVTSIIFVLVASVLAYATLKFKARDNDGTKAPPPEQSHGNPMVELSLIGLSVLALVFIAVPTLKAIWFTYEVPEAERANAYEVTAIGYQWWFKFEYPAEKAVLPGGGEAALVTANELVIPAHRPVRINLRTIDVIHSFWVPKLAGKVDMMPNRANHLWLKADEAGYYWGQCAEYCGESHAVMRFRVIALEEPQFQEWLAEQKKLARTVEPPAGNAPQAVLASYQVPAGGWKVNAPGWTPEFDAAPFENWNQQQFPNKDENPALVAQGRKLFQEKTCVACHTVRGHEGIGVVGPDLTRIGSRTTIAAGLLENSPENLHRWLTVPNDVKPGNNMWFGRAMPGYMKRNPDTDQWEQNFTVSDDEARALVAYLHSLK